MGGSLVASVQHHSVVKKSTTLVPVGCGGICAALLSCQAAMVPVSWLLLLGMPDVLLGWCCWQDVAVD